MNLILARITFLVNPFSRLAETLLFLGTWACSGEFLPTHSSRFCVIHHSRMTASPSPMNIPFTDFPNLSTSPLQATLGLLEWCNTVRVIELLMHHLVVVAPRAKSFNHAVTEAYTPAHAERGHRVSAAIYMLWISIRCCHRAI